jgi:tetratricopeptide (TPR) repeat protein
MIGLLLNNRYRIDVELGRGGLGTIYRAHDELLNRDVAVKLLNNTSLVQESRSRLLHEARVAAQLNHPNIVTVYDAGEAETGPGGEDRLAFIVMELIEGKSLHEHAVGSIEEACDIIRQVCLALEAAHARSIIHRDLKPENVLITENGLAKLTDFGLARSIVSRLSREGALIGTIFYMAPELALNQPVDPRTDLYALGVMFYEMAAGRLPFDAADPIAVISQHLHAPVVPPSTYNPRIPPGLDALILRLMSKRPEDRPGSASEVRVWLDGFSSGEPDLENQPPALSPLERLTRGRLIGREAEFAEIRALWQEVVSGRTDERVLFVSGEAGVGKTPLVREILALAEVSGGRTLHAECFPEGSAPFGPISQIIRQLQARYGVELPLLVAHLALPPGSAGKSAAGGATGSAASRGSSSSASSGRSRGEADSEGQRQFERVFDFLRSVASQAPLLVLVEDVHWADSESLYLLRYLARRARALKEPILIVLTYRSPDMDDACCLSDVHLELHRERLARDIHLVRFNRDQTRLLLNSMFQEEMPAAFIDLIYQVTEGNLFFIEEICKTLIEEGKVFQAGGHWRTGELVDLQLPQSVRMTILARIGKYDQQVQEVLRFAAVIGQEFDFTVLQAASGLDEDLLIQALETAEEAQLITEARSRDNRRVEAGHEMFAFAHGLIPAILRESLSSIRRHRMHRRVAEALETHHPQDYEALAYHCGQAGDHTKARTYHRLAGDRALNTYANREAERHYQQALELAPPPMERAELLAGLGEASFRRSHYEEASSLWQEAVGLFKAGADFNQAARFIARAARSLWYTSSGERGLALCRAGLEDIRSQAASPDQIETPGMAALLHETARAMRFCGSSEEALPLCRQALEMARRLGLVEVQAEAYATLGILPGVSAEESRFALSQSVELSESAGLYATAVRAYENLGEFLEFSGDLAGARSHHIRGREVAHKLGNVDWEYHQMIGITGLSMTLGDFGMARETLAAMRKLEEKVNYPAFVEYRRLHEARLMYYTRRIDPVLRMLGRIRDQARLISDSELLGAALTLQAEVLLEACRESDVVEAASEVLRIHSQGWMTVIPQCTVSVALARQGKVVEARQALEDASLSAQRDLSFPQPPFLQQVWLVWTSARIAALDKNLDQACTGYAEGAGMLRGAGARWYLARTLEEWMEVLRIRAQDGDESLIQQLQRQAIDLYSGMGLSRMAAQTREKIKGK